MGSVRYRYYNKIARDIWQWAEDYSHWLAASYIPSRENVIADRLSRLMNPDAKWVLSPNIFTMIVKKYGEPEVDLFASRVNKKCECYVCRFPDAKAWQIEAFTFPWTQYFFYAFPSCNLILRTLEKIGNERAKSIIVVPNWKNQSWYPMLLELTIAKPMVFEPNEKLLFSVYRKKIHSRVSRLGLITTVVSGQPLK